MTSTTSISATSPSRRTRSGRAGRRRTIAVAVTTAILAATVGTVLTVPQAAAAAPVIVNTAAGSWLESRAVPKDSSGQNISVTFVVRHSVGQVVTGLAIDDDWDGTDNTLTVAPDSVSATQLPGGPSNYSAVRYTFTPPNMPQFSCGLFSGTRRTTQTLRVRAVTADGQRTGVVTASVHGVENNQCLAVTDFPFLFDQTQSATSILPGQSVTFSFRGDDADVSGHNDAFDKYRWQVRRLNDGAIVHGPVYVDLPGSGSDNVLQSLMVTFPQRGRYVVEAELGGEDDGPGGFENANQFFRIGAVDVNSDASTSPTVSLSAPSVVQAGAAFSVTAAASDAVDLDGRVQMIRWDRDGVAGFEDREFAATEATGLTTAQMTRNVTTSAGVCTDRTITAEVTDNGALNGADAIRRARTTSRTVVVNCPPVAANQTLSTPEDTPLPVALAATDGDGDPLTFAVTSAPANGTLSGTTPNLTYTPNLNFFGTDSFQFDVADGNGGVDSGQVDITVTPVNDAPVANPQSVTTSEDTPVAITLTGSDVDGDTLTFSVVSGPANGTLSGTAPNLTYTPNADVHGSDSFVFQVDDGNGGTASATVNITVSPVQDGPVANPQSVTTPEDTPVAITLTGSDVDGDSLTFSVVSGPANGTLSGTAPNLIYSPAANFHGSDSFTFLVDDGHGNTDTATVDITVTPVNDAPVAHDQSVTTPEDTPVAITLTGSDVDGDSLTFSVVSGPANGTLSGTAPNLTYSPNADFHGSDSFVFQVDDGNGGTATAVVDITVTPVNDAPVAHDQSVTTPEDTPVAITLTGSDVDGDSLTFSVVSGPANGTLSVSGNFVVYTPALNYLGPDAFTFLVDDGNGGTDTGVVDITVGGVNDPPVAHPQSVYTDEDTPVAITLTGSDADGDPLTFAVLSGPTNGTLSGTAPNLTYTPAPDFQGADNFLFEVDDGNGGTDTAVVHITVGGVNDPPVAHPQSVYTDEDTPLAITLTADDADGDPLAYSVVAAPVHGTLAGNGDLVVYTPGLNYFGVDSFVFLVDDGNGGTDTAVVDIVVRSVNDAPDAIPQHVVTDEDTPVVITLTAMDVEGDPLTFAVTSQPSNGTLSGTAPNLTYTPAADYTGFDSFTFEVSDGNGGTDSATISITVQAVPLLATTLYAHPAVAHVLPGFQLYFPELTATLTVTATGTPLPGRTVTFYAGGGTVCTAVTNADGVARCGGVITGGVAVISLGYTAFFAGDADHGVSSDNAPLAQVGSVPLL
jgi:hypothetical protein